jgi:hypothetical protein
MHQAASPGQPGRNEHDYARQRGREYHVPTLTRYRVFSNCRGGSRCHLRLGHQPRAQGRLTTALTSAGIKPGDRPDTARRHRSRLLSAPRRS